MPDVLTLGGFQFGGDGFSAPAAMPGGGRQAMVVHKLPGGSRVINTLGPDEANPTWSGFFFGETAYNDALAVDAMRAAGNVLPLVWGGSFRLVIIESFEYQVTRQFMKVDYRISCVVQSNPALGGLGSIIASPDVLILADIAAGLAI